MWNSRSSEHLPILYKLHIYGEPFVWVSCCLCLLSCKQFIALLCRCQRSWAIHAGRCWVSHNLNYAHRIGFHIVIFCIWNALKKLPKLWFAAHLTGIIDMNDSLGQPSSQPVSQPALLWFHVLPDAFKHTQVRMSSLVGCLLSIVNGFPVRSSQFSTHRAPSSVE